MGKILRRYNMYEMFCGIALGGLMAFFFISLGMAIQKKIDGK